MEYRRPRCAPFRRERDRRIRAAAIEIAGDMGLDGSELAAIFLRGAYTRACWIQGRDGDWLIEHVASCPPIAGAGCAA